MPEVKQYVYTHKEIAELLIKDQGIHEGLWGTYFEFSFAAANTGPDNDNLKPSAVAGIDKIGIQRFDKENNLTLDASKVNPARPKKRAATRKRK